MSRVVLVVGDDPAVLELVAEMLTELGCEVITQQESMAALGALAQDQRIELLLTDINMPGIAGHELAKQAKRLRPLSPANAGHWGHGPFWGGVAAGVVTCAVVGNAIASRPYYPYGYYGYYAPPPPPPCPVVWNGYAWVSSCY